MQIVINDDNSNESGYQQASLSAQRCGKEIEDRSRKQDCKIKSREIMVQEQLALHDEKWEIM